MNKAKVTCSSLSHLVDMRVFSRSVIGEEFMEGIPVRLYLLLVNPRLVKILLNDGKPGPVRMGEAGHTKD
jgi:hypothetical protein